MGLDQDGGDRGWMSLTSCIRLYVLVEVVYYSVWDYVYIGSGYNG